MKFQKDATIAIDAVFILRSLWEENLKEKSWLPVFWSGDSFRQNIKESVSVDDDEERNITSFH